MVLKEEIYFSPKSPLPASFAIYIIEQSQVNDHQNMINNVFENTKKTY